jgi:hypothetical protein
MVGKSFAPFDWLMFRWLLKHLSAYFLYTRDWLLPVLILLCMYVCAALSAA